MSALKRIAAMVSRADSWFNPMTGFGTSRDRTTHTQYCSPGKIDDQVLADLYHNDDMAEKATAFLPKQALRRGFDLKGPDSKKIQKRFRQLDVYQLLFDGDVFGRVFGGAALFLGVDDGGDVLEKLDERKIRSLDFLTLYDRRRAWPLQWYDDPKDPKYGWPKTYMLQALKGGMSEVHESRLMLFGGAHTAEQEKVTLNYWDYSIIQRCYEALRQFNENNKAAELMLSDASQGVFKMSGLLRAIAGGEQANLATRAALLDMGRSIARSIFLDADSNESFEKIATAFAGIADMLDRSANRLAAATGIPVTFLMGQAPAGLNATGAADTRSWYDEVAAHQEQYLQPRIERLVRIVQASLGLKGEIEVIFKPLWQPTGLEKAQEKKTIADTDAVYIQNEVITPEEVTENRFGGDEGWSPETKINMVGRLPPAPVMPPKPPALTLGKSTVSQPNQDPNKLPPATVDTQAKPGEGRFPLKKGPTVGDPWPTGKQEKEAE